MAVQTIEITDKAERRRDREFTDGPTREFKPTKAQIAASNKTYAAGQVIGNLLKLKEAVHDDEGYATLMSVVMQDGEASSKEIEMLIFDEEPASTVFTDGVALTIHADDLPKHKGSVSVTEYKDYATNSAGTKSNIGLPTKSNSNRDLWVVFVDRGGSVFTGANLGAVIEFFG